MTPATKSSSMWRRKRVFHKGLQQAISDNGTPHLLTMAASPAVNLLDDYILGWQEVAKKCCCSHYRTHTLDPPLYLTATYSHIHPYLTSYLPYPQPPTSTHYGTFLCSLPFSIPSFLRS